MSWGVGKHDQNILPETLKTNTIVIVNKNNIILNKYFKH